MFKSHIKLIVLQELKKKEMSGYDLMKKIESVSDKKPSPGYIYPLLKSLTEKKLVSVKKDGRRKIYSLNKDGLKILNNMRKDYEKDQGELINHLKGIGAEKEVKKIMSLGKISKEVEGKTMMDLDIFLELQEALLGVYGKNYDKNRKKYREMVKTFSKQLKKLK